METKHLTKSFIWYGVSTAINKGVMILAIPLLSGILNLQEYGIWTLSQVVLAVCAPILSFNGYASILRFGIKDKQLGNILFTKYIKYALYLGLFNICIYFLFGSSWVTLTLLLSNIEALQILYLGWLRSRDKYVLFFIVSTIKIMAIVFALLFLDITSLIDLLRGQLFFGLILLGVFYLFFFFKNNIFFKNKIEIKKYLSFSLYLIPHNIALWILSSSDRVIIKNLLSELDLGVYSLAYSLALILMIVNSGIALTLPNFIIKKYEYYIKSNIKILLISGYSISTIILNIILYWFILYFKSEIEYLGQVNNNVYNIIIWIFNGIYLLGLYYFYSNILFYKNKAKLISINTFLVSIINIILTVVLVLFYNIKGAAIATFIAYSIYLFSNVFFSYRLEKQIKKDVVYLMIISVCTIILNFSLFDFFPKL